MNAREDRYVQEDEHSIMIKVAKRITDNVFKIGLVSEICSIEEIHEKDYGNLTASEVLARIHDFLASDPSEVSAFIFLNYLAGFPVSMCKHQVTPVLETLISCTYRLGVPTKEQAENGVRNISMDDLSEWFVRSKATISEHVQKTESIWKKVQAETEQEKLRDEAHSIALEELVREEKEKLRAEQQNNQNNSQKANKQLQNTAVRDIHIEKAETLFTCS
ncbi:hypothetical protein MUP01_03635 [Candidatus Bathyarchaeota archaeon]|nr:hypothetical protein [Candidatus Bathyarchaeota archaeon]